jgi:hypothetical protein
LVPAISHSRVNVRANRSYLHRRQNMSLHFRCWDPRLKVKLIKKVFLTKKRRTYRRKKQYKLLVNNAQKNSKICLYFFLWSSDEKFLARFENVLAAGDKKGKTYVQNDLQNW